MTAARVKLLTLTALLLGSLLTACDPPTKTSDPLFFKPLPAAPDGMVVIPAGPFIMGSDKTDVEGRAQEFGAMKPWYLDEHPAHSVDLPTYYIDRTEVTNQQYSYYLLASGAAIPNGWDAGSMSPANEHRPVTGVNWYQANGYCEWIGKHLPSEAEWEKASRGTDAREYPWGNGFDAQKGNTGATRLGEVMPVGHFPEGASPYGVLDLVGNVWEWTGSWYQAYPGSDYQSDAFGTDYRVIRGGGWGGVGHYTLDHFYRSAYRFFISPSIGFNDAGFRCVKRPA